MGSHTEEGIASKIGEQVNQGSLVSYGFGAHLGVNLRVDRISGILKILSKHPLKGEINNNFSTWIVYVTSIPL